jgi:hypothetical protein
MEKEGDALFKNSYIFFTKNDLIIFFSKRLNKVICFACLLSVSFIICVFSSDRKFLYT